MKLLARLLLVFALMFQGSLALALPIAPAGHDAAAASMPCHQDTQHAPMACCDQEQCQAPCAAPALPASAPPIGCAIVAALPPPAVRARPRPAHRRTPLRPPAQISA